MTDCPRPLVDVILPIHSPDRPLDRAVASVVDGGLPVDTKGGVRIIVICHNVEPDRILPTLRPRFREMITVLALQDNGRTPGEPRNCALDHVTAEYVCFVDSDDTLDPGALARWVDIAQKGDAAVVLARLAHGNGGIVRTPVTRPGRAKNLDALADRLVYRTHVFGLIRADAIERLGLRFPEGFVAGEDQSFSLPLYSDAGRIDYAPGFPGYVLHDDATDRITSAFSPLAEELKPFLIFSSSAWLQSRPITLRRSYAVKVLRVQLFGAVTRRTRTGHWTAADAEAAQHALRQVLADAPGAERAMSRADRELMDVLEGAETDLAEVSRAAEGRRRFGAPATLMPRNLTMLLHRDSPLRFMVASALLR